METNIFGRGKSKIIEGESVKPQTNISPLSPTDGDSHICNTCGKSFPLPTGNASISTVTLPMLREHRRRSAEN